MKRAALFVMLAACAADEPILGETEAALQWNEQGYLLALDGELGDGLGRAVAISGDTAIIGAPFDDRAGTADAGAAYVFVRSGGAWASQAKIQPGLFSFG